MSCRMKSTSMHLCKLLHVLASVVRLSQSGHMRTMTKQLHRPGSFFHASTPYVSTTSSLNRKSNPCLWLSKAWLHFTSVVNH
eukprot:10281950-Ditylum_brightwellii.AAC.1